MMRDYYVSATALLLALLAYGCGDSSTAPSRTLEAHHGSDPATHSYVCPDGQTGVYIPGRRGYVFVCQ